MELESLPIDIDELDDAQLDRLRVKLADAIESKERHRKEAAEKAISAQKALDFILGEKAKLQTDLNTVLRKLTELK